MRPIPDPINKLTGRAKLFCRYAVCFYIALFLTGSLLIDHRKVWEAKRVRVLNDLQSSSSTTMLWALAENGPRSDNFKNTNKEYYAKIRELFPRRSEGYGLSGFIAFFEGNLSEAGDYYEQAIKIDPDFFWYHYNLGLIRFRQGLYEEAYNSLFNALKLPASSVLKKVQGSPQIYGNIISAMPYSKKKFAAHINGGYKNAAVLLLESLLRSEKYDMLISAAYNLKKNGTVGNEVMFYYTGLGFYHKKEYPQAIMMLRQYYETDKNDQQAGYYLGKSMEALGMGAPARKLILIYSNLPKETSLSASLERLYPQPY